MTAGHYNFGYIDSDAYTGNITYVPVDDSQGYWGWTSSGYAIGSGGFTSKAIKGIVDTGTTLILLPSSVVSEYYGQISGAKYDKSEGGYVFDCGSHMLDFMYGVTDTASIRIPGKYFTYAPTDSVGKKCFGGLQSDGDFGFAIFGDVALKAAFVVFDAGRMRLGFASKSLS